MQFLHHARGKLCTLILEVYIQLYTQVLWSHKRNILNNHNMQVGISYLNINIGILNRKSMKIEMINFIIPLAQYYIDTSKYKQQKQSLEVLKITKTKKRNITLHCLI